MKNKIMHFIVFLLCFLFCIYILQFYIAHINFPNLPLQDDTYICCKPLCWWFVRSDILTDRDGNTILAPPVVDAKPGDILVSFATHSFGWRHGHAGLVINENETLECRVIGEKSAKMPLSHWQNYPCYALLRYKEITPDMQEEIVSYACSHLTDIPYRLGSELYYPSCNCSNSPFFGINCASLVWYAYDSAGINLHTHKYGFVTPASLFHNENLEVIQIYGMAPPKH